jgi:hypothetical protein
VTALPDLDAPAVITGEYRYVLNRRWLPGPVLTWVMLNPSIADADTDDPTITRCVHRAILWAWRGIPFGGIRVVNLFALRATHPAALAAHHDPAGPDNDQWLKAAAAAGDGPVVAAWGTHGNLQGRADAVRQLLADTPWLCLGTANAGEPRHPLYVGYDVPLIPYPASR